MRSQSCIRIAILLIIFLMHGSDPLFGQSKALKNPTFKLLSGSYNELQHKWRSFSTQDKKDFDAFARNYDQKIGLLGITKSKSDEAKIPRLIHFIWIGPKAFPAESVANVASWKKYHPDWKMFFWTDSKDRPCPIEGMELRLIDEINFKQLKPYISRTNNPGEQADLIRNELIYEYGGVYVDHDVTCFRSFEKFNIAYDFYAGLEDPHLNVSQGTRIFPCNCLFGARAGHPILKSAMDNTEKRWNKIEKKYPGDSRKNVFNRVIGRTFHSFTLATKKHLSQNGNVDMVFPSSFFFAHKLFHKKTIRKLKKADYVFASHKFAYVWQGVKKEEKKTKHAHGVKKTKKHKKAK